MRDADWHVVYVLKTRLVQVVIRVSVRTKTGAKTDNAQYLRKSGIVMNVMKSAEKGCWEK